VRFNTEKVELVNIAENRAILSGVQTYGVTIERREPQSAPQLREVATVHHLTVTLLDAGTAAYTIEWLENLPAKHLWPDTIRTVAEKTTTVSISLADGALRFVNLMVGKDRAKPPLDW